MFSTAQPVCCLNANHYYTVFSWKVSWLGWISICIHERERKIMSFWMTSVKVNKIIRGIWSLAIDRRRSLRVCNKDSDHPHYRKKRLLEFMTNGKHFKRCRARNPYAWVLGWFDFYWFYCGSLWSKYKDDEWLAVAMCDSVSLIMFGLRVVECVLRCSTRALVTSLLKYLARSDARSSEATR